MTRILRKIRVLFTRLFMSLIDIDTLLSSVYVHKTDRCYKQVTYGKDTVFHPGATVDNLQGNKAKILIGSGTHIRGGLLVWPYGQGIEIGDNCYLGKNSIIWAGESVKIGNNVLISHNVTIIDSNSHEIDYVEREKSAIDMFKNGHPRQKASVETSPINIEDNVWISYNVCILKGVKIRRGAIIAAGSVVTKDVSAFTLVAGNPATFIKNINAKDTVASL